MGPLDESNDFHKCAQEAILQQLHQRSRREWHYQPLAQGNTNSLLKPPTSFDPTTDFQGCIEPIWQIQESKMTKLCVDHLIEIFLTLNADFQFVNPQGLDSDCG